MNKLATAVLQTLKRTVRFSVEVSNRYLWLMLLCLVTYGSLYFVTIVLMLSTPSAAALAQAAKHSVLEATSFLLICHLFIRPYLKLVLLPQGHFGWKLLGFVLYSLLVGQLMVQLSFVVSHWIPNDEFNLHQMNIAAENKQVQLNLTEPMLQMIGGVNMAVTSWLWALAYMLWHTVAAKRQMQLQMHQAQLQQLTNQLNPHFLFNALNSIRGLIFEDQHKAADAVTQLSELFRVHLQAHLRPLSTLAEEWQLANQYLQIEQIRLEQRLTVQSEFAEQLWQQSLPTLSLLTLIENAIKHGIAQCPQGGVLTVKSQTTEQGWQLVVCNSCPTPAERKQVASTATGLLNIRKRLQLMGGAHRLDTTQNPLEFCSILSFENK